ncbi:MAG: 5-oxoprolinase subunit PxpA [Alphaproteobacteria bacterium]
MAKPATSTNRRQVDLNSDMGEGFGRYTCGDDAALLEIVSSANVACGFHAGDPEIMAETFRIAKTRGVAIGAHPGFPDLWGFGRRRIPCSTGEIERMVAYQVGAAQGMAAYAGHRLTYVKSHGALGNIAETDQDVADAITRGVKAVDPSLACLIVAMSAQVRSAEKMGMRHYLEIFADRAYTEDGHLVPRKEPGAVIHDAGAAAARVIAMVEEGAIITVSGARLKTAIDSVCVHGDSPHALGIARLVRQRLEQAGVAIAPFAPH